MLDLKKDKEKKFVKLNLGFLLISEMGLLSFIKTFKKIKIKINHNKSSNHKYHSHKQVNKVEKNSVKTDDGSADFHLEITKEIDTLDSALQKKSESPTKNTVELRSSLQKKPEVPQFLTDEETENIIIKTCFKEKLFETNPPAEVYDDFKRFKDTSSLKNNENVKNKEFLGWMSEGHDKASVKSTKGVPRIKIKREKKQNILNDPIWSEEEFKKIKKKKNGLSKQEEWAEKKEEELKKEMEKLRQEKELLKKQEKELKKEEKQKERERKLEAKNALKEQKESEKQKRLEEKQKLKEERIEELDMRKKAKEEAKKEEKLKKKKLKEELIKKLELEKKAKEENKRKKIEEKKSLKKGETEKEKAAITEESKDGTDETLKEFDNLVLDKKNVVKEKMFLDEDVENIIPVIDTLLEKLPDDVIAEFAESDDFVLYEKVVKKYKNK